MKEFYIFFKNKIWTLMMLLFVTSNIYAQTAGEIDLSFNLLDNGSFSFTDDNLGADGFDGIGATVREVYCMALQPDGKILVGGSFQKYNHENKRYLVRLHPDGSLDTTFNPQLSVINKDVYAIVVLPDGKILVGGYFYSTQNQYIVRLNEDGSLDESFESSQSGLTNFQNVNYPNGIKSIALQPDGKIIAGGIFNIQGVSYRHLIRLNPDGSRDDSFDLVTVTIIGEINDVKLQTDGKILAAGGYINHNGIIQSGILRFHPEGSVDTEFNTAGNGANSASIETLTLLSNGKMMIGGSFSSYNGTARKNIARLNANGSLDTSFNTAGVGPDGAIRAIHILPNGKMLIAGEFFKFNNQFYRYIARLNANGSLDASFNPDLGNGKGTDSKIFAIEVQADGKILIGGDFMRYRSVGRKRIARIFPDGDLDITFNPGTGANRTIQSMALQSDGKILVGGTFTIFNKEERNGIARLNPDGTLDESFVSVLDEMPDFDFYNGVRTIAVQPDGKILIGGAFTRNGVRTALAQLHPDGSWDDSFQPLTGQNQDVKNLVVEPDGKILITGGININDGTQALRRGIARLNADGSLDPNSFVVDNFSTWWLEGTSTIALQPDGKMLVGGMILSNQNSTAPHTGITRLNADESEDTSFNPGGAGTDFVVFGNGAILKIVLQPDGKILIGGQFSMYNDTPVNRIARLNTDGTLDTTFHNPAAGTIHSIYDFVLQEDGKIIVVGSFSSYDGVVGSKNIIRLNTDGTIDTSFNAAGTGASSLIRAAILQPDGKIIIGGSFISYNGTGKNRVARIHGDEEPLNIAEIKSENNNVQVYPNPVRDYLYLSSVDETIRKVTVFDLSGKKLFENNYNIQNVNINLSHLEKSLYIVNIITNKGSKSLKIIKE